MKPAEVLAQLRVQADSAPDFATYTPTSQIHLRWLGTTHSLVDLVNKYEAVQISVAASTLYSPHMRDGHVNTIMTVLYRAIAHLEASIPAQKDQIFGPGAVYDFMRALSGIVTSAGNSLLVVDPYLDDQIFDTYLAGTSPSLAVRILTAVYPASLKAALTKFNAQHGRTVEVRKSALLHDRLVFVDGVSCWLLGQSIKDAAASKPTYLAPLSSDLVTAKLAAYELIWQQAQSIV